MKTLRNIIILIAAVMTTACGDDFFEQEYHSGLDAKAVDRLLEESPDAAVNSLVNGIYSYMVGGFSYETSSHDIFTFASILHTADMTGQDMVQQASHWFNYDYEWDNRMFNYRRTRSHWGTLYTMIAKANSIINLFSEEPAESNVVARAGLGQALAVRGLAYYYLIQLYQQSATGNQAILDLPGVPLKFADSEQVENKAELNGRNTVKRVHEQIESDLTRAVTLLKGYTREKKIYINQAVATGFLARYYLLAGEWQKAVSASVNAQTLAAQSNLGVMNPEKLHDGFYDIENSGWMWGFDHTTETQTTYASWFSMISNIAPGYAGLGYAPRLIDKALYDQISKSDERKQLFNDEAGVPNAKGEFDRAQDQPHASLKFGDKGDWTMDYVYMRVEEIVLIEAEALAHLGDAGAAAAALGKLMAKRDPKWHKTSVTVDDVFVQRRIELWGEGFNFFDFKRLGKDVNRAYSGSNHRVKLIVLHTEGTSESLKKYLVDWTYQIPLTELNENPLITDRNP
ncbi:MAG: RagB/SusD family nutrient uptake outer membrane protein [Candidatus Symbiothrix sp.]|jgi:hypothetical protein|nr:RagB/SusD family nutrient uptake outer membrane protein [Candidatus Symbiothrix sp.]